MSTSTDRPKRDPLPGSPDDRAVSPIVWLITRYLLVRGGIGTLDLLLALVPPDGLAYKYAFGVLSGEAATGFEFERASCFCGWLLEVSMFAGGMLLWRRPSSCVPVVWILCTLTIVHACAQVLAYLQFHLTHGYPLLDAFGGMVDSVGPCAAVVCLLWFLHRGFRSTRRVVQLVGGVVLIVGMFSALSVALMAETLYRVGRDMMESSWTWIPRVLAQPVLSVTWIAAGLWLLMSPRKAGISIAALLLCVNTAAVIALWLPVLDGSFVIPSGFQRVETMLDHAPYPLTALVFLWFALRHRGTLDPEESVCSSCGYLLHGLPTDGHHCPECGTFFVRRGAVSPGSSSASANSGRPPACWR